MFASPTAYMLASSGFSFTKLGYIPINSSTMIGNFPAVSNLNQLFLKLNRCICNQPPVLPEHWRGAPAIAKKGVPISMSTRPLANKEESTPPSSLHFQQQVPWLPTFRLGPTVLPKKLNSIERRGSQKLWFLALEGMYNSPPQDFHHVCGTKKDSLFTCFSYSIYIWDHGAGFGSRN